MHTIKDTVKMVHVKTFSNQNIPVKNYVADAMNVNDGDIVGLSQILQIVRANIVDCIIQEYYSEWCKNEIPTLTDVVDEDRQHNEMMEQVDKVLQDAENAIRQSDGVLQQAKDEWEKSNLSEQTQKLTNDKKTNTLSEFRTLWKDAFKRGKPL